MTSITRRYLLPAVLLIAGFLAGCSTDKAKSAVAEPSTPAAGASGSPAGQGGREPLGSSDAVELATDYQKQCSSEETPSRACEILRRLLVVEVAMALEDTERSRDQRDAEQAAAALDFADEPEIFIAACRILGHFPPTPGIAGKMLPQVLESPYLEVQRAAAQLLSRDPDEAQADVGRLWMRNHEGLSEAGVYDEYPDFPAHYAGIGFPKYPAAEWFSPADSDRSIGWSTKDDVAAVSRWFSDTLHAEAWDMERWMKQRSEQAVLAFKSFDQSKMTRIQQLAEKMAKGDQSAAAEIEKLQKEMEKSAQDANASVQKMVDNVALPPGSSAHDARWIVAQTKGGRVSTVVLVYQMPKLQRTVIQLAWDLSDYPSAWPKAKS